MGDTQLIIKKKNSTKAPRGACFDIKVEIGDASAAFTFNLPDNPKDNLIAKTWDDRSAYFLGLLTPTTDGSIYLVNCKCVLDRFIKRTYWEKEWLGGKQNWHTCVREKCASICCERCFEKDRVKKINGEYKCPYSCKGGITCNKFNDEKKKQRLHEKVDSDQRECCECHMTRKKFMEAKPFCKPMSFTAVPDNSGNL